ncbi:hypothetical protein PHISCL_04089 [Aspergillus sclerotialis]|uniref:ATP-dependent helicase dcl1 n=1 Tax=Aspergillus sclerotialis TaxID=2070753 RepID=A0A3A2ZK53_9EURO|nr:hypothetical protein PHISCL_04089 [Aspergillus sclerotialis]
MELAKSNTEFSAIPGSKISIDNTFFEDLTSLSLKGTSEVLDEKEHSSSDESDNEDAKEISEQQKVSERKRVQNAQFEALLSKHVDSIPVDGGASRVPDLPDAQLSTAHLVAKQDFGSGTLDPREYQIELFERAKERNTIAVLDTGSGKTLIAVLLLKHIIQNELNDRSMGKPHRISFFLVDSVTLVYQQAAVLRNNIDQNIGHFFGAMGLDLWSKQTWDEHFEKNMVIVCTAEILCQCLLNSYIKIEQINLLIFDEAHHTKKEHPYARIIRDSYLKEPASKRPRIFGMTASPIDAKGDIVEASLRLETLLDSRIATTSKLNLLRQFVSRPIEVAWTYDQLHQPFATDLYKIMKDRFGDIGPLEGVFRFAWVASSELGKWCSDRAWTYALGDDVIPRLEGKISKLLGSDVLTQIPESAYQEIERIREASDVVKCHEFSHPSAPGELSPKVQLLRKELEKHFGQPTETKCIIFTEKRYTARSLLELFMILDIPHLRPGMLVGVRSGDIAGMNNSFRQQFISLVKFRKGEINCLFATAVAEEGLDIPDCNLVIRFDLYHTLIQYVQSRGRARHMSSTYASMIEKDNVEHEQRLEEVKGAERVMRNFCEALPEDRILQGNDNDLESILQSEERKRTYKVSSTGAKLTYRSATSILARYASSLQYEKETSAQVTYVVLPIKDAFVCEVILPEKSPIRGLTGKPDSRKSLAKQSAAFDTCLLLRKNKLLDDYFNSVYHRRLPAMRNAKLAITSKARNMYDMISKPSFWNKQQGTLPVTLYATVISFLPSKELTREHGSIILLTRERMPDLPPFPIFLDDDVETTVISVSLKDTLPVSAQELESLTTFTLRVFRDVFHKTYERQIDKMPYWFAPVATERISEENSKLSAIIDWSLLFIVEENDEIRPNDSPGCLTDRFVFDHWDGRYRYFTIAVDDSLRASDKPPAFVPHRRHMEDIMNYSLSLSKNSRARFLSKCDWGQPVIRAELVRLRRNLLDKMTDAEKSLETRCVICLEPLKISAVRDP